MGTNLVPEDKELQKKKENRDVCYFTQRRKRGEQNSTRNTINDSARSVGIISTSYISWVSSRDRAVFKWLSKVITWLRLLRLVIAIGLKDSRQFFSQWEAKPKPIAPCTRDFSSALNTFQIIARNCDWFIVLFLPLSWLVEVIALVFVFRQSFENRSIVYNKSQWISSF